MAASCAGVVGGLASLRPIALQPKIAGLLDVESSTSLGVVAVVATIVLAGLGSFHPAGRATRVRPAEAVRNE